MHLFTCALGIVALIFLLLLFPPIFFERDQPETNMSVEPLEAEPEVSQELNPAQQDDDLDLVNFNLEVTHEAV